MVVKTKRDSKRDLPYSPSWPRRRARRSVVRCLSGSPQNLLERARSFQSSSLPAVLSLAVHIPASCEAERCAGHDWSDHPYACTQAAL